MASQADISRVAKILARATSPNAAEAETALHAAYARMKRDGVTLLDLLTLPEQELYQDALADLAKHIVKNQPGLSPSQQRSAYNEYLARIVRKFNSEGQGSSEPPPRSSQAQSEREEAARAYEERRRQEETRRQQEEARASRGGSTSGSDRASSQQQSRTEEKPFSRQNGKAAEPKRKPLFAYDASRVPLDFSFRELFDFLIGRDSLLVCLFIHPWRGVVLTFLAGLGGLFFSAILVALVAALIDTAPSIGKPLARLMGRWEIFGIPWFAPLLSLAFMFAQHKRGWFPGVGGRGTTGLTDILRMVFASIPGILWRLLAPMAWLVNTIHSLATKTPPEDKAGVKSASSSQSESARKPNTAVYEPYDFFLMTINTITYLAELALSGFYTLCALMLIYFPFADSIQQPYRDRVVFSMVGLAAVLALPAYRFLRRVNRRERMIFKRFKLSSEDS